MVASDHNLVLPCLPLWQDDFQTRTSARGPPHGVGHRSEHGPSPVPRVNLAAEQHTAAVMARKLLTIESLSQVTVDALTNRTPFAREKPLEAHIAFTTRSTAIS